MKNIVTFIIICLFVQCKSQFNYSPGATNPNANLDKFVGKWIWNDGNESLEIILKKENILLPIKGNVYAEAVVGFHKYKVNNSIVENSTQYSDTGYNENKSTILGYTITDPNKLEGEITHLVKNKNVEFEINYIDSSHIKLIKFYNPPGIKINVPGQPPYDPTISLPQDIVLTKQ